MPPRYAYWTILAGGLPTSFRAVEQSELLPTFNRLKEKQPDAEMKWFSKGKLWNSPEEARAASPSRPWSRSRDDDRPRRPRPDESGEARTPPGPDHASGDEGRPTRTAAAAREKPKDRWRNRPGGGEPGGEERRGKNWRPGGTHADPRQKFIDAKKARNQRIRQERFDHKQGPNALRSENSGDRTPRDVRPPAARRDDERAHDAGRREGRPREDRPWRDAPHTGAGGARRDFERRPPSESAPRWTPRPDGPRAPRSEGGRGPREERRPWTPRGERPKGDRPERRAWSPKGEGFDRGREHGGGAGRRPWTPREDRAPRGDGSRPPFDRRPPRDGAPKWEPRGDRDRPRPRGEWSSGDRPRSGGFDRKPGGGGFRPGGGDRPRSSGAGSDRPRGGFDRKPGEFDRPRGKSFGSGGGRPPAGPRKPWSQDGGRGPSAGPRRPFKPQSTDRPRRKRDDES